MGLRVPLDRILAEWSFARVGNMRGSHARNGEGIVQELSEERSGVVGMV